MHQPLTLMPFARIYLALLCVILSLFIIVFIVLLFSSGHLSSEVGNLSYDRFEFTETSFKYITFSISLIIAFMTSTLLFLLFKLFPIALSNRPIAIIEAEGIRYCKTSFQPEGFLHWNNISSYKRFKLGPIKGGIFIKAKIPSEVWSKTPIVDYITTSWLRIITLGMWRKKYSFNLFGLGGHKEFSNNDIEKLLNEVTKPDFPKPNSQIEWHNLKTHSNRTTVLASFTIPIVAITIGFASHHFSYLWDNEVNVTRQIRHFAHQGNPDAQTKLGWRFSYGVGTSRSHREAVYWFKKAAEQGYAKAQYNLGIAYYSGEGIKRDYDKAFHWLTLAAEQNQPNSFSSLAKMYHTGRGVEKSYKKAHELYNKAISLGLTYPYASLGYMHEKGEGVLASKETAIEYYKKAATDNNKYAIKALKRLGAS